VWRFLRPRTSALGHAQPSISFPGIATPHPVCSLSVFQLFDAFYDASTEEKDFSRRILACHLLITRLVCGILVTRVGDDEKVGAGFSKPSGMVKLYTGVRPATYTRSEHLYVPRRSNRMPSNTWLKAVVGRCKRRLTRVLLNARTTEPELNWAADLASQIV